MVATSSDKQATDQTVPGHLCITKSRPMLTEAEKEARRVRRILANRESARLAIRKKQDIYAGLKRRAADALEENENLKKEKELALKEYASLKQRNEFLKAQMATIKKATSGETQEDDPPKTSSTEVIAGPSISSHRYLWPSVIPYSDVSQFHHHSNITVSTQNTHGGPRIPLYLVPVPCLIPVVAQSCNTGILRSPRQCSACSSYNSYCIDKKDEVSTNQFQTARPGFTPRPKSSDETVRNFQVDDVIPDLNVVPATNSGSSHGLTTLQKNEKELVLRSTKRSENAHVAAEARRKRKELMKMKDTISSCHGNTRGLRKDYNNMEC